MNINYGDEGLVIKYIQAYLYEYYSSTVPINGIYDETTHNALVKYLSTYNVQEMSTVIRDLNEKFPDLFSYFKVYRDLYNIRFVSKYVHSDVQNYISSIENDLYKYVETVGWRVSEFTNYNSKNVENYVIKITKQNIENRFPNKDIMCTVNQFDGRFYYNLSFIDGGEGGIDGIVHSSNKYKICIIECEPEKTYTISHGYTQPTLITVCCSQYNTQQIIKKSKTVDNIESVLLSAGSPLSYKTNKTAKTIIVQIPNQYTRDPITIRVPVRLGDINMDDKINNTDRDLLSDYIKSGTQVSGATLVACAILQRRNSEGELYFDNDDLAELDKYLNKEISNLGIAYYDQVIEQNREEQPNKLLILSGDYVDNEINIPFDSYSSDSWMVNDKFLNYILDRSINQYSDSDSIAYLQNLVTLVCDNIRFEDLTKSLKDKYSSEIKLIGSGYTPKAVGKFDDSLKNIIKAYQKIRGISFALGYLDVATEANMIKDLYKEGIDVYEYWY